MKNIEHTLKVIDDIANIAKKRNDEIEKRVVLEKTLLLDPRNSDPTKEMYSERILKNEIKKYENEFIKYSQELGFNESSARDVFNNYLNGGRK